MSFGSFSAPEERMNDGQRALALILLATARTQNATSVLIPYLSDNSKPTASSAPSLAKPLHRSLSPQTYNLSSISIANIRIIS